MLMHRTTTKPPVGLLASLMHPARVSGRCCNSLIPVRFVSSLPSRPFSFERQSEAGKDLDSAEACIHYVNDSHPLKGLKIFPNAITEDEHNELVTEIEGTLKGKKYIFSKHWDQVIEGYRELERSLVKFSPANQSTLKRLQGLIGNNVRLFPHVHILDIHEEGIMKPHVDSIKFSGGTVAGLSLLTPCVFELHHEKSAAVAHVLLEPRTFYILSDEARYDWAHGIGKGTVLFKDREVTRSRRISVLFRDFKTDDVYDKLYEEHSQKQQEGAQGLRY